MTQPWTRRQLSLLIAAVAVAVCFVDLLAGERVFFFRDLAAFHVPMRQLIREGLWQGELPLWNPAIGLGMPLAGDASAMPWYLPGLLFAVLPIALAINVFVVGHLVLAAVGAAGLSRAFGGRPGGGAVAGICYGLSGYLLSQHWNLIYLAAAAWLPWLLWAWQRECQAAQPRTRLLASGALAGLVFSGDLQLAALAPLLMLLQLLLASPRTRWREGLRSASVIGVFGYGLAALQLLPTWLLYRASTRADGLPLDEVLSWSLHPSRIVEMVLPYFYATALPWPMPLDERGLDWVISPYQGVLSLALAALAASRWRKRSCRWAVVLAVLFGLLAMGGHTPLYRNLVALLPLLEGFRYPEKFLVVVALAIAVLAGQGVAGLGFAPRQARGWLLVGMMTLVTVAGLLLPAAAPARQLPSPSYNVPQHMFVLTALTALVVLLLGHVMKKSKHTAWLLVSLAAVDLILIGQPLRPTGHPAIYTDPPPTVALVRKLALDGAPPRMFYSAEIDAYVARPAPDGPALYQHWYLRTGLDALRLHPNSGLSYGLQHLAGYSPLAPRGSLLPQDPAMLQRALDIYGVAAVLTRPQANAQPSSHRKLLGRWPMRGFELSANTTRLSRCLILSTDVAQPYIDRDDRPPWQLDPSPQIGHCQIDRYRHNSVELSAKLAQDGWLMLAERAYPGWQVELDGQPAELHALGGLLRAVKLTPGAHRLVFRYRPVEVWIGALISLLSALGLGLMLRWPRRRTRLKAKAALK